MASQRRPSSQIAPVDSASPANGIELRSFFLGRELASRHFETGQKLDIAPLASGAALADAEFLLVCAILRPAFGQLVLGICFVLRAALGPPKPTPAVSSLLVFRKTPRKTICVDVLSFDLFRSNYLLGDTDARETIRTIDGADSRVELRRTWSRIWFRR